MPQAITEQTKKKKKKKERKKKKQKDSVTSSSLCKLPLFWSPTWKLDVYSSPFWACISAFRVFSAIYMAGVEHPNSTKSLTLVP